MKNKFAWVGRKLPLILSMMLFLGGRLSAQSGGSSTLPCTPSSPVSMACPATIDPFGGPIALTGGLPAGGVYSGAGVANGYLDLENKSVAEFNQIVYTFTDASGCEGNDSCKYAIPCDPKVSMDAKKEVCLGDTIELFVDVDMPDLFSEYTGWPVLQQAPMPRNGRLKSDVAGYGSEAMNVSFKEGQIILSSNLPLRGLDVNLDDSTFKNVKFGIPTDLSGIASSPMMNSDQIWFQWQASSFNTVITENTIGLNYTGKLPDTMVFSIDYSYYVNSNMISTTDVITVIIPSEGPVIEEPVTETQIVGSTTVAVTLLPVPAHNELLVKSNFAMDYIVMFDKLGRKLIVQSSIEGDNSTIDLSQLSQGVYLLQVFGANGEFAQESFTKL